VVDSRTKKMIERKPCR